MHMEGHNYLVRFRESRAKITQPVSKCFVHYSNRPLAHPPRCSIIVMGVLREYLGRRPMFLGGSVAGAATTQSSSQVRNLESRRHVSAWNKTGKGFSPNLKKERSSYIYSILSFRVRVQLQKTLRLAL